MKNRLVEYVRHCLFEDESEIWHKLLNVILCAMLIGVVISLIICSIAGLSASGNVLMGCMILIILFGLWLSNGRNNPNLAAIIVTAAANMVCIPAMYVINGGMHSGMPIWQVVGLLFSWLVLKGKVGVIMFVLNFAAAISCIILELVHPEYIIPIGSETLIAVDIIQSMLVASVIIGIVFKYSNYLYEKQKEKLVKKEEDLNIAVEEAKRADNSKSDFLAHMSHEIRTPINAILGMDEMILRESRDNEISSYASNIQSAGNTLLSLVNDILDFSKIESGKMEIIPSEYHTMSLLNDCYNLIAMRAKSKNIDIIFKNDETLPTKIYGDEIRVRQIISNLLTNGVKYTEAGSVTLKMSWEKKERDIMLLIISVKDTGKGITKEGLEIIFDSFKRIEEKKNRNIEGTGLGLTITKQLVDLMGGTISVESEYGKGSEFKVAIPQIIVSEKPLGNFTQKYAFSAIESREYKESFKAPAGEILVVDDVYMNLEVTKGLLEKTLVKIDIADSGRKCLELTMHKKYHMIFMDHMMPDMDGIETMKALRKMKENPNVDTPVIVLTANAIKGAEEEYLAQGFAGYISKPVKSAELEKIVRRFLPEELIQYGESEEKPEQDSRPILERIDFLDVKKGMDNCAYSEELYEDILRTFVSDSMADKLEKLFNEENWENYRIQIHALKGTARTIGDQMLSDRAMNLETAAKQMDIEYIKHNHSKVLKAYKELLAKLEAVL